MFKRKLHALNYPQWDRFDLGDPKAFRTLVVWLEDQKIRHYPVEARAPLRNIQENSWNEVFWKYLEDLEAPSAVLPMKSPYEDISNLKITLNWLFSQAVTAEYGDKAIEYNNFAVPDPQAQADAKSAPEIQTFGPDFQPALNQLCSLLQLPEEKDIGLDCILRAVRHRIRFLQHSQSRMDEDSSERPEIPLGFSTNDPLVDEAALVLRLQYINGGSIID